MTKLNNHSGFSVVEALLILVVIGILGFTGWFVYYSQKVANKSYSSRSSTLSADDAKTKAMASWSTFSDTTIGLRFRYPSDWGQAKLEALNATSAYKVSFTRSVYLTVTPKAALQDSSTTFESLKSDNQKYPDSRHVFVNGSTVVGDVVPSNGNQDAEIYAARSITLKKIDASSVVLVDAKKYSGACVQATYTTCYTTDELHNYQWLLESASAL